MVTPVAVRVAVGMVRVVDVIGVIGAVPASARQHELQPEDAQAEDQCREKNDTHRVGV